MRVGQLAPPTSMTPAVATKVAAGPGVVADVATTPADLEAMGAVFRSAPVRAEWIGPVQGRYDLQMRVPGNDGDIDLIRQTGSARVYHAKVGTDEWALAPFFNPAGTGFMHQPSVLHRVAGAWQVVTDDPAPGELHEHLPKELLQHWDIVDGMPPKDSVTNDAFPEF